MWRNSQNLPENQYCQQFSHLKRFLSTNKQYVQQDYYVFLSVCTYSFIVLIYCFHFIVRLFKIAVTSGKSCDLFVPSTNIGFPRLNFMSINSTEYIHQISLFSSHRSYSGSVPPKVNPQMSHFLTKFLSSH